MAGTNPPNLEENRSVFMGLPWFTTLELHIPYIDIPKLYVDYGTETLDRSMVPFVACAEFPESVGVKIVQKFAFTGAELSTCLTRYGPIFGVEALIPTNGNPRTSAMAIFW